MSIADKAKEGYNEHGEKYNSARKNIFVEPFNPYVDHPTMAKLLLEEEIRGKRFLDLGCGAGFYSDCLQKFGAEVVGVDISETMLSLARRDFPHLDFREGNAESFVSDGIVKPNSFDSAIWPMGIHYTDLSKSLNQVNLALKQGGIFYFSTMHPDFLRILTHAKTLFQNPSAKISLPDYLFKPSRDTWSMWNANGELLFSDMPFIKYTTPSFVENLSLAGFNLERMVEPQATSPNQWSSDVKTFLQADSLPPCPEWFAEFSQKHPTLVHYKARKL